MSFLLKNKFNILFGFSSILFFLLGLAFFDQEIIISIILFFVCVISLVLSKYKKELSFKTNSSLLYQYLKERWFPLVIFIVFCISMTGFSIYWYKKTFESLFHYLFLPVLFVVSAISFDKFGKFKHFPYISFFIGLMFQGFLSCGYSFSQTGIFGNESRNLFDFWSGKTYSATLLSMFFLGAMGICVSLLLIWKKKNKSVLIVSSILIALMALMSALFQNRGFFVATLILLLIFLVFVWSRLYVVSIRKKRIFWIVVAALIFFFVLFIIAVSLNWFGLKDIFKNIPILNRFIIGGSDSERTRIYFDFFKNMFLYPFGGMNVNSEATGVVFVHNVWLDVHVIGGFIPMICFILITILIFRLILIRPKTLINKENHLILSGVFVGLCALFLFEPIINGSAYIFTSFFYLYGYVIHYWFRLRKRAKHVKW